MQPGDRVRANSNAPSCFSGLEGTIHSNAPKGDGDWRVQFDGLQSANGMRLMWERELDLIPDEHTVDCRSADGITIGLIDGIIAMARVLTDRNLDSDAIKAALEDLRSDEDMYFLMTGKIKE